MDIKQLCHSESNSLSLLSSSLLTLADEFNVLDDTSFVERDIRLRQTLDYYHSFLESIPSTLKAIKAFKHQLLVSRQQQLSALKQVNS